MYKEPVKVKYCTILYTQCDTHTSSFTFTHIRRRNETQTHALFYTTLQQLTFQVSTILFLEAVFKSEVRIAVISF